MQFVLNQVNHYKILKFNDIVYRAAQKARVNGYFSEDITNEMIEEIKEYIPSIEDEEISYVLTTVPKYRLDEFDKRELISYEVSIPLKKIIAKSPIFKVEDNSINYVISGKVHSEVLSP
jgi:hypothetical protein